MGNRCTHVAGHRPSINSESMEDGSVRLGTDSAGSPAATIDTGERSGIVDVLRVLRVPRDGWSVQRTTTETTKGPLQGTSSDPGAHRHSGAR